MEKGQNFLQANPLRGCHGGGPENNTEFWGVGAKFSTLCLPPPPPPPPLNGVRSSPLYYTACMLFRALSTAHVYLVMEDTDRGRHRTGSIIIVEKERQVTQEKANMAASMQYGKLLDISLKYTSRSIYQHLGTAQTKVRTHLSDIFSIMIANIDVHILNARCLCCVLEVMTGML